MVNNKNFPKLLLMERISMAVVTVKQRYRFRIEIFLQQV